MKPIKRKVRSKLVRILFNNGDTYSGEFTGIEIGVDQVILTGPGKLLSMRKFPWPFPPTIIEAPLQSYQLCGIRRIWVGRM